MNEFIIQNDQTFVNKKFLLNEGVNNDLIDKGVRDFVRQKSKHWFSVTHKREEYILIESIPDDLLSELAIPSKETILELCRLDDEQRHRRKTKNYTELWFLLRNTLRNDRYSIAFRPSYKKYFQDDSVVNIYARNHAVIQAVINIHRMQKIPLKTLYCLYIKLDKMVFCPSSLESFYNKINECKLKGILESIIHDFKLYKRYSYKFTDWHKARVVFWYSSPKKYRYPSILKKVNREATARSLSTISLSTIKKFLNNPEIKNRYMPIRMGEDYSKENLYPYLPRDKPEFVGDLWQLDSYEIPIFKDQKGDEINLFICIILDVKSTFPVGFAFSVREDRFIAIQSFKNAVEYSSYLPREVVIDNAGYYNSSEFNHLKIQLEKLGVCCRFHKPYNPGDKGHVERFNKSIQELLREHIGFKGDGLNSKKENKISRELYKFYSQKRYVRSSELISKILIKCLFELSTEKRENQESSYEIFKNGGKPNIITVNKPIFSILFWTERIITVQRRMIIIRVKRKNFTYTIFDKRLGDRINKTKVRIRLNKLDMSRIRVFDVKTDEYLIELKVDEIAAVASHSPDENRIIYQFQKRLKELQDEDRKAILEEVNSAQMKLFDLPITALNTEEFKEDLIRSLEDKFLIDQLLGKDIESEVDKKKRTKRTQPKDRSPKSRFYKKGSMKVIKSKT